MQNFTCIPLLGFLLFAFAAAAQQTVPAPTAGTCTESSTGANAQFKFNNTAVAPAAPSPIGPSGVTIVRNAGTNVVDNGVANPAPDCGIDIGANAFLLGSGGMASSVTFTFNQPVSNVKILLANISTGEIISATTDAPVSQPGNPSSVALINQTGNCNGTAGFAVSGNTLTNSSATPASTAISVTGGFYSTLTLTTSGSSDGLLAALCFQQLNEALQLTKAFSPASFSSGGNTVLTFSLFNPDNTLKSSIGFTDALPAGLVAVPGTVVLSGFTTGGDPDVTLSGANQTIHVSGAQIVQGGTGTISLQVTNNSGQLNTDCTGNPAAFTNGATNITAVRGAIVNAVSPQCVVVTGVLPVVLSSFRVEVAGCAARLDWTSATEVSHGWYEVEWSADGRLYAPLGRLQSRNHASGYSYSYVHPLVTPLAYYRLKMIDLDGRFTYSVTVSAKGECNPVITVGPNPLTSNLIVAGLGGGESIAVWGAGGQQVFSRVATSGINVIPVHTWAAGMYLVQIVYHGRVIYSRRVVK